MTTVSEARPANMTALARSLMGRLTRVQTRNFGPIRISPQGLFIKDLQVAFPHEILETARLLAATIETQRENFGDLQARFNEVCKSRIIESEADVSPIENGLNALLREGPNIVSRPQGAIVQDRGTKLYVNGEEIGTPEAALLAEAMARRNVLGIEIGEAHNGDGLLKAISAFFNNNELQAKGVLEALGIKYHYLLPSESDGMVFIASSDGLVEPTPILTIGELKERGFRMGELVLHDPRVVKAEEALPPSFNEKVAQAVEGLRRLSGGDVVVSTIDLIAMGRGNEVFGLAIERNPSGVVKVGRQAPKRKISPVGLVIDDRGCLGAGCGTCVFICPQDAIEMVVPQGREAEVAGRLEAGGAGRDLAKGPIRIEGTFGRIREGCDGCLACVVVCLERGDCITITGLTREQIQKMRLGQYPPPEKRGDAQ